MTKSETTWPCCEKGYTPTKIYSFNGVKTSESDRRIRKYVVNATHFDTITVEHDTPCSRSHIYIDKTPEPDAKITIIEMDETLKQGESRITGKYAR